MTRDGIDYVAIEAGLGNRSVLSVFHPPQSATHGSKPHTVVSVHKHRIAAVRWNALVDFVSGDSPLSLSGIATGYIPRRSRRSIAYLVKYFTKLAIYA